MEKNILKVFIYIIFILSIYGLASLLRDLSQGIDSMYYSNFFKKIYKFIKQNNYIKILLNKKRKK